MLIDGINGQFKFFSEMKQMLLIVTVPPIIIELLHLMKLKLYSKLQENQYLVNIVLDLSEHHKINHTISQ